MATAFHQPSPCEPILGGLVVIARNTTDQIVIRITSHRDLVEAMYRARCVLKLKLDAVHVKVHYEERSYLGVSWETIDHSESRGSASGTAECVRLL